MNQYLMTALRTARGLNPGLLTEKELLYARSHLSPTPQGNLRISEPDWLLADALTLPLLR